MKKIFCVFDTETNGLLSHPNLRIVSIAWIIGEYTHANNDMILKNKQYHIIKPDNYVIGQDSINIHGITQEDAEKNGIDARIVMLEFLHNINLFNVSFLVAHNIDFDRAVISNELSRLNIPKQNFLTIHVICTMKTAKNILNLKKYPKLTELILSLSPNYDISNAHDALWDAETCLKSFHIILGKFHSIR